MYRCTLIGISDSHQQWFPPEVLQCIARGRVFSGGKRHHEIVQALLPAGAQWIDITVPLSSVFEQYEQHDEVVIFASGDPLFYGFGATVQRECPGCQMRVIPSFNSLQMLAHRMALPYEQMHAVSLTGRDWERFDEALIRREPLIGVLTDRNKTPHAIHQRMQQYGYTGYEIHVGENLGNEQRERVSLYSPDAQYECPNCLILRQIERRSAPFGLPESEFHLLDGRINMITKMPIRLCTLSALDLGNRRSLWDVGFCTGSISIEARLQFPHLRVTAFEIRSEGEQLMRLNSERFGAPGIQVCIGDFLEQNLTALPAPDAVFIGGHGGRLGEMMERLRSVLLPGGVIVFNSVSEQSRALFIASAERLGMQWQEFCSLTVDHHNPITILRAYDTL